jgi:hypothetical protein
MSEIIARGLTERLAKIAVEMLALA